MTEVAIEQAVVWSVVLRIHLRSRILWKHDLESAEICCSNDIFISKITPRWRAKSTGERMTLLGRWLVGLLCLESCYVRPKMRHSVLEGLRLTKLEDIHLAIVFSRWVILWEKSTAANNKRSWVSSAAPTIRPLYVALKIENLFMLGWWMN